jgi:outer membrane lipoprotein-sorting protein
LYKRVVILASNISVRLVLAALALGACGCAVRRETRVRPSELPPVQQASLADLVAKVNSQSEAVRTLTATVDLEPTAGSVYSGVIKEYHDVKGFVLAERPATIRMIGQAPVIRTNIFDMVSDGEEFRLFIPPKQKFIVGKTAFRRPTKNALENLRPQHLLEALLVPPINASREKCFSEEAEEGLRRYYVVSIVESQDAGELRLKRKVWFDRSNLELARAQFYEQQGTYVEDVRYAHYQDFQGVLYPTHIEVSRPIEDYRLMITILKATFNQPIPPEKFELKKPESAELVDLSAASRAEGPRGQ